MTSHPTADNRGAWWLTCGKWRRLHAIPGTALTPEAMRAAIDHGEPAGRRAVCGLRRRWTMPGITSRLTRRRCSACCTVLAIAPGAGTPANET